MSVASVGRQFQDSRHVLFSQILDIIEILFLVFTILSSTLFLQQCKTQLHFLVMVVIYVEPKKRRSSVSAFHLFQLIANYTARWVRVSMLARYCPPPFSDSMARLHQNGRLTPSL